MPLKNAPLPDIVLFNPDVDDFTCSYDIKGTGEPEQFTVKSMQTATYPNFLGQHIKKYLVNHLIIKWNKRFTDEEEVSKIKNLVEIKL